MTARRGTYVDLDCFRMDDGRVMVRLNTPGHRLPEEYVPAPEAERLREAVGEAYSCLTRADDAGPDVTETAVEAARMVLADVLVDAALAATPRKQAE